jgi:predicted metal-dependent enzyme (double-stranded beta helix superfamily)
MTTARESALSELYATARRAQGSEITRQGLGVITQALATLASRRSLFPLDDFPLPSGKRSVLYVLGEDDPSGFVIYAVRSEPVSELPAPRPHNHTTWATVATVYGHEHQEIYERTDDEGTPGWGSLRKVREFTVRPGSVIGYLPDDYHSVASVGDGPTLALHFYGRGLERLTERIIFDGPEGGHYETFLMGREMFTPLPVAVAS